MSDSAKVRDFLNELIAAQPEVADLLDRGILANEAICDREDIFVRPTEQGKMITITGIITAISRKYGGEAIASVYTEEPRKLYGFGLYSEGLPRIISAIPSEVLDGTWRDADGELAS